MNEAETRAERIDPKLTASGWGVVEGSKVLREFQDNEKSIPTILTTSQKLSTGVDARNIRNIVLMRPVNSMIEFKQIVGRGTRLFDGKEYFTIYDFVDAYHHFADPEWDGEPIEPEVCAKCSQEPCVCVKKPPQPCPVCGVQPCECNMIKETQPCYLCGQNPCACACKKKVKIKLRDGKLADAGYGQSELAELQRLVDAEKSDLFDVLEYIAFNIQPMTRDRRVSQAKPGVLDGLSLEHKEFLEFVLFKYIDTGFEELGESKLPNLIDLKYHSMTDAAEALGGVDEIRNLFFNFQKHLYERPGESKQPG